MDKVEDEVVESGKVAPPHGTAVPPDEPAPEEAKEIEPLEEVKESEAPEEVKETKKPVDIFADEKKADMTPLFLILGVLGLAVVFLLIAWLGYLNFSTAVYFSGLTFMPLLLWLGRKTNTVYVVFLACVIAVLMTCIYFLWVKLAEYHFDVKASEAKQRVGMIQSLDRGWQLASHDDPGDKSADC